MPQSEFSPPRWAQEIPRYLGVKPQYVLWGNIHDIYPIELGGSMTTLSLEAYLGELLASEGYGMVCRYVPLSGFEILRGSPEAFEKITGAAIDSSEQKEATLLKSVELIEKLLLQKDIPAAVLLSFGSRLPEAFGNQEINEFFYRAWRLGIGARPFVDKAGGGLPRHNALVWLMNRENDLPAWYGVDNPRVHIMPISRPDHAIRKYVVDMCAKSMKGYNELDDSAREEKKAIFLDQTGGMFASEIIAISQIARREEIPFTQIADAIRRYKLGIIENPWARISRHTFEKAEENLNARVIGQPEAVGHAVDVLKRSLFNLSGAQFSRLSQKPKGVLFLAGPTGVGKTELAKSLTEMIFGTPTNYLRFDMSEFAHEHADQRLLGSPPGYVGYDAGGQLTNAVREKPFSLILFDEIEKSNPKIMDIFLQILDDGRLTSGRGETVYFSECLIVFTSNLGVGSLDSSGKRRQAVTPDMPYEQIRTSIMEAIENHFNMRLGRPEILNRIGKNIIVFDFIRPEVAEAIFQKMLGNVLAKLQDEHHMELTFSAEAREELARQCCGDLSMGGRGIGNAMEEFFLNPLSRALFEMDARAGSYRVERCLRDGARPALQIARLD